MYNLLRRDAPIAGAHFVKMRLAPYIARESSMEAARLVKKWVKYGDDVPYPLLDLVHLLNLSLDREIDTSKRDVRWAIAHDLGHWLLGHPNRPFWYLECEADIVARELLIPKVDVMRVWTQTGKKSPRYYAETFGIPVHKAEWALSDYFSRGNRFECPLFPSLDCASFRAIAECHKSNKPPTECAAASAQHKRIAVPLYTAINSLVAQTLHT